jgi:hypothetical protein
MANASIAIASVIGIKLTTRCVVFVQIYFFDIFFILRRRAIDIDLLFTSKFFKSQATSQITLWAVLFDMPASSKNNSLNKSQCDSATTDNVPHIRYWNAQA